MVVKTKSHIKANRINVAQVIRTEDYRLLKTLFLEKPHCRRSLERHRKKDGKMPLKQICLGLYLTMENLRR